MENGSGIKTEYTYNNANLVKSLINKKGSQILSSYAYNYYLDGNQESKTDKNGLKTSYEYEKIGRLTKETEAGINKNVIRDYTYDNSHNRISMKQSIDGVNVSTTYEYDKNNRLLKEVTKNTTESSTSLSTFSYDGNVNQITKSKSKIYNSAVLDNSNLRIYILNTEAEQPVNHEDYKQELIGKERAFSESRNTGLNISLLSPEPNPTIGNYETEIMQYDGFNRLTRVNNQKGTIDYKYKTDGLRISKK